MPNEGRPECPDLPDWTFRLEEASNGAWRARGEGPFNLTVERFGTDERELEFRIVEDARSVDREAKRRLGLL